jgi:hypothetical protein
MGEPELWFHPMQSRNAAIPLRGDDIYTFLLPDRENIKLGDPIRRCFSIHDLRYFEKDPKQIPREWKGKLVHAWASVVLKDVHGTRMVPFLNCKDEVPTVQWDAVSRHFNKNDAAALHP